MDGPDGPVKLLLSYDPLPECEEAYFQYVLGEFVPALAQAGLPMCEAWLTAYGPYPRRLTGFLARDVESLRRILASPAFRNLESRLQRYVVNYRRRIVRARPGFQL